MVTRAATLTVLSLTPLLILVGCQEQSANDSDGESEPNRVPVVSETLPQSQTGLEEQRTVAQPGQPGDDAKVRLGERLFHDNRLSDPGANLATSCRTCHVPPESSNGERLFAGYDAYGVLPANTEGAKQHTLRNTPSLIDVSLRKYYGYDGAQTSLVDMVAHELTSRHMGWTTSETDRAKDEIHALVLNDMGLDPTADGTYLEQFQAAKGVDLERMSRDEIFDQVVGSLADFLNSLVTHNTSSYDAMADMNRLNTRLAGATDTPQELSGRIFGRIANQEGRVLIRFVAGMDEASYQGMKTFMRVEPTYSASTLEIEESVGNCIACHVPPKFTDDAFHNTGVTQFEYDAVHGGSAFAALELSEPSDATRSRVDPGDPSSVDLGRWNVDPIDENIAAFRTPMLRNLMKSDPFMHNGQYKTLEDVIRQKIEAARLAKEGKLRNADPELLKINLKETDIPQLVAFLEKLREVPPEEYRDFRISNVEIRQDPQGGQR